MSAPASPDRGSVVLTPSLSNPCADCCLSTAYSAGLASRTTYSVALSAPPDNDLVSIAANANARKQSRTSNGAASMQKSNATWELYRPLAVAFAIRSSNSKVGCKRTRSR